MFYKIKDYLRNKCRTCMSLVGDKKQYIHEVPLVSGRSTSVMELLKQVQPQIDVQIEDDLPKLMCLDCVKKLQETHTFLEKYKYADKKFRSMLQSAESNREVENCQLIKTPSFDEIAILAEVKYDFNNLDAINLDYANLDALDADVELEITNLEIDIDKVVNENVAKESYEDYENISDWSDFYDEPDIGEITSEDMQKLKYLYTFYSDASDNECGENITSNPKQATKISAEKHINIIQLNSSPAADRNSVRGEIQETHASHQNKYDSTLCKYYENKKNSKISQEKRKASIEINDCVTSDRNEIKILKQKISRNCKTIRQKTLKACQDGNKFSQVKSKTADITLKDSTNLNQNSSQEDENEISTKKSPEKNKTDVEVISTGTTVDHSTTKSLKENNSKPCKEMQGLNMATENEDDGTSCQEFENDKASCQEIETPETCKQDIEINGSPTLSHKTTKNLKQKRKRKYVEETLMSSEKEDDSKSAHGLNISPTLKKKTAKKQKVPKKIKKVEGAQLPPQNEDGSFSCRKCDMELKNVTLWQEHMSDHAKRKVPRNTKRPFQVHKCEQCNKEFNKKWTLKCRMRTHSDEAPFQCVECGKCFKFLKVLDAHMNVHKGEKTIQCPSCPKKFLHVSGLYTHKMVHTNERPFVCDICGKGFYMAVLLRKHKLYHNNTRNYPCGHCDKRFFTGDQQRRHLRTHTGEKPYRCTYCERAFAQSNDCIKHLRLHLGDNVYRCELCPKRFPLARDLRKHFCSHKDEDEETRARNLDALIKAEKELQIKLGVKKDVPADVKEK